MTDSLPETETRSQFAARVGVTPGRISQLVGRGLPLTEDRKRVRVADALRWMDANLAPHQVLAQRRPKVAGATSRDAAPSGGDGAAPSVGATAPDLGATLRAAAPIDEEGAAPGFGATAPDIPPEGVADRDTLPDAAIPPGDYSEAKTQHEWWKCRRAALEYERAAGRLIAVDEVEREQFARGRAERDSWQSWVHRIAPILAAELRADEHAVFVALQREVDDHLSWLADTPLETLGAADGQS